MGVAKEKITNSILEIIKVDFPRYFTSHTRKMGLLFGSIALPNSLNSPNDPVKFLVTSDYLTTTIFKRGKFTVTVAFQKNMP